MEDADIKNIIDDIEYLAAAKDNAMILNILIGNHPADIATIIQGLPKEEARFVFGLLDADTASDVLVELDDVTTDKLVADLRHERLSEIVDEMDSDDATDLVADLPEAVAEKVLESIDQEDSAEVKELLRHEEDSAGGIMALEFVTVWEGASVDQAVKEIRTKADEVDEVYNVYAVDRVGKLVGFVPLKRLLLAKSSQKVSEIMRTDVVSVPIHMDQEEVANIFGRYNLVSMPVVDDSGKLVGRITVDDIVDVMNEEASEDIQKMAGIADEEGIRETSIVKISLGRLPWLLVAFGGQLFAAFVLRQFQVSLKQIVAATLFIPLMMAMGGNTGIQAATIIVRGIALGELGHGSTFKRLVREVRVSLFNGTVVGTLLFFAVGIFFNSQFGAVVSVSVLIVILNASIVGAGIPLILHKFKVDPAIATGPLVSTCNDILGVSIYLSLVTLSLKYL